MPRPGVDVTLRETPQVVSASTDTGVLFAIGEADRGPTSPRAVGSLAEFESIYGGFVAYSSLYNAIDVFFREGGALAFVSRVVGDAATLGTLNLLDASAGISLVANAIGPGAWSADYQVQVVAGVSAGTFIIRVLDEDDVVLEDSGELFDQFAALAWSQFSEYIRLTLGASALDPAPLAATALSAGADDRGSIDDANWQAALDRFDSDLGPGQVTMPGRTTSVAHAALIAHAEDNNRFGILDYPNSPTVGTLQAAAAALPKSRFAMGFAPWPVVPGLVFGTERTVPPSAMIAGMIARNDPGMGAKAASAGNAGISRFAIDLSQPDFTATQRETLNASGVNVIRRSSGIVQNYGWRSLANPATDQQWVDGGAGRYIMGLTARLDQRGESFVFGLIDGQNGTFMNSYHTALAGECMIDYNNGQLFGDSADQAFSVNTGPQVNPLEQLEQQIVKAIVSVKLSPIAEWVRIEIVKRRLTETL